MLVYQLSVHYTFAAGADRVARTFFGGRDVEWVNPTSGAFNVRRRDFERCFRRAS